MPYKDPAKQRAAKNASAQRIRDAKKAAAPPKQRKWASDGERRRHYEKLMYAKNKAWLQNYKSEQGCSICGIKDLPPCCYDLHHTNPVNKEDRVSRQINRCGFTRMLTEVQKCIVLCANCHRVVHWLESGTINQD